MYASCIIYQSNIRILLCNVYTTCTFHTSSYTWVYQEQYAYHQSKSSMTMYQLEYASNMHTTSQYQSRSTNKRVVAIHSIIIYYVLARILLQYAEQYICIYYYTYCSYYFLVCICTNYSRACIHLYAQLLDYEQQQYLAYGMLLQSMHTSSLHTYYTPVRTNYQLLVRVLVCILRLVHSTSQQQVQA